MTYESVLAAAERYVEGLAKPPGALGGLEAMACRLWALQRAHVTAGGVSGAAAGDAADLGTPSVIERPSPTVRSPTLLVFAADHGSLLKDPSLSAFPRAVTAAMFATVAGGGAACTALARAHGVEVVLTDVGVDHDLAETTSKAAGVRVVHDKVMPHGTRDAVNEPAMRPEECRAAMAVGAKRVDEAVSGEEGATVVCLGELGLGNTTAAAALLAGLTGSPAAEVTGAGTGVTGEALTHKTSAVALAVTQGASVAETEGAFGWLRAVGGLELAAMAGAALRARELGVAVVVDGFIAGTAALAAVGMDESVAQCLFMSHVSAERGAETLRDALVAKGAGPPPLHLGMRLGEGTGAVLAVPLLRAAAAVFNMATLASVLES